MILLTFSVRRHESGVATGYILPHSVKLHRTTSRNDVINKMPNENRRSIVLKGLFEMGLYNCDRNDFNSRFKSVKIHPKNPA